jgi:hypothetical protein
MAEPRRQGLLGEYGTPERLIAAVHAAREAGMKGINAFTPFPVDDVAEALGFQDNRIPWLGLIGGVVGLVGAYAMQIATNLDYPLNIGGRPLITFQAFALIGFELTVLFSVSFMVFGLFVLNRLPRYHHPLFDIDRFERVTRDGFFLFVAIDDEDEVAAHDARALLEWLGANSIDEVLG